jgi:hypothetical protein
LLGFFSVSRQLPRSNVLPVIYDFVSIYFPQRGDEAVMSNEAELKEVMELLHELKLELVAEMDYASLELQVEAIIDKVYALTETSE